MSSRAEVEMRVSQIEPNHSRCRECLKAMCVNGRIQPFENRSAVERVHVVAKGFVHPLTQVTHLLPMTAQVGYHNPRQETEEQTLR